MSAEKYTDRQIKSIAGVMKLLSEPNRLRILLSLTGKCHSVSYIIKKTGLSQTNVSFHLRTLREADLVKVEPRGIFKYY